MRALAAVLGLGLQAAVCLGQDRPSEAAGAQQLAAQISGPEAARLKVVSFTKTDGQSAEAEGVKLYRLDFIAEAEVVDDALIKPSPQAIEVSRPAPTLNQANQGFSWDAWNNSMV